MTYSPFEFVKALSFVRYGGTPEERQAAQLLMRELSRAGGSGDLMEFEIPKSTCQRCGMKVIAPFQREIPVTPYGMCAPIPSPGKDLRLYYAERGTKQDYLGITDLSDAIVMVDLLDLDAYRLLCELHAGAILVVTGKYYQSAEEAGIYPKNLRPHFLEHGKIPTFLIGAGDATELLRDGAELLHAELEQTDGTAVSQNVLAVIPGTELPEEQIVLTAHYDSVPLGTGAWDNATGAAALMGLYHHFIRHPTRRTLRFIWCGSEEQGLLGSKAFIAQNEALLEQIRFCFNFDMCGTILGHNDIFVTGGKELETFVDQFCRETGYSAKIRVTVHSSDSAPFADRGIPSLGLSRGTNSSDIHNCRDLIFPIGELPLKRNIDFAVNIIRRVGDSAVLPVDAGMPEDMQKELDQYFHRAEKDKK